MQSSRRRRLNVLLPLLVVLGLAAVGLGVVWARGAAVPNAQSLSLQPVLDGLRQPVDLRHAGDGSGRLFIVEKAGTIRIARGGRLAERAFLDIRELVGSRGSEQGLLGLAFHPRFIENGYLYVNYTDLNGDTVVARYQVSADDPDLVNPDSASIVLTQDQPFANHNGGNLVFGPDNMLWIGLGDGGSAGDPNGNAQRGGTWLGKMLRIDVDGGAPYAIPPDNPYVGASNVLPEIWALGLRNPWRYTFDRATGDLFIGDVGQNAWEEVNYIPAGTSGGLNFGWNVVEASHCFRGASCDQSGFVAPVAEYRTGPEGCAVVGGYVYRGTAYPTLQGTYLYADECSGRVWSMVRDADGAWHSSELLQLRINISSFGEDQDGELYATGFGDGVIYRVAAG